MALERQRGLCQGKVVDRVMWMQILPREGHGEDFNCFHHGREIWGRESGILKIRDRVYQNKPFLELEIFILKLVSR